MREAARPELAERGAARAGLKPKGMKTLRRVVATVESPLLHAVEEFAPAGKAGVGEPLVPDQLLAGTIEAHGPHSISSQHEDLFPVGRYVGAAKHGFML